MVAFFNSFFNYVVLMLAFVAVGAVGGVLGAVMSKKKAAAKEAAAKEQQNQ
ncbi:MAG: hypothetical protein K6A30_06020 [Lachnospiraceae bacterium]|nr:hypothetical protein [Lachnospiraceae bacterium]